MSFINYASIPIITGFLAYFLNKKIKYSGAILNTIVFAYIFSKIIGLYNKWDMATQTINLNIIGKEIEFIFKNTPLGWLFAFMTIGAGILIAIFSIKSQEDFDKVCSFNLNFAILIGSILGVVFAGDFLTLFIFWELMAWSSFYLISAGKKKEAITAAFRYFIISAVGAYTMLMAMFIIYNNTGSLEFNQVSKYLLSLPVSSSIALLAMMSLPFLTKAGIFPVHIWVNGAHSSAPKEFSPFLSGLLLKIGAYGMILIFFVMPFMQVLQNTVTYRGLPLFSYMFAIFGGITTIAGTILAIRQEDVKRLVAFSSISQMGYIIMALAISTPLGFAGGMLHIMNHLIFKTTIFMTLAAVIYRTGTTKMSEMGGLIFRMPVTFAAFLAAIIALVAVPPTNGFISKWVIYQSLIQNGYLFLAIAAFFGSIGSFMYAFRPLSTIFLGQLKPQHNDIKEVPFLMQIPMYVMMLLIVLFGVFPGIQMSIINKIAIQLGINPVNSSLFTIEGAFGSWNSFVIFNLFGAGFAVALIIFIIAKKSKLVGLLDTYTSGEYMNDPELYHFAYEYFRPFERLFDGFASLSLTRYYETLVGNIVKLGNILRKGIVTGNGQTYALYSILFFVILAIVGWII
jgi:formate hydrogenlyase subunit 3/multisubunit Na+/H+ antiporter MnhD subunit